MKLKLEGINIEKLFEYIDFIRRRGVMVFIKYDGERNAKWITVIISYPPPNNSLDNQIRFEGEDLKDLLIKSVYSYKKYKDYVNHIKHLK